MKKIISLILATLLVCSVIMPVTTVVATDNSVLYETSTTWFPITEETGGNAEYFLAKGSYGLNVGDNKTDFIPMVDFGGVSTRLEEPSASDPSKKVGYYAPTGTDTVVSGQLGAFGYTIDAGTDNTKAVSYVDLTTKEDGLTYWNINGKDYAIDVNGRVIKILNNVRTELIEDEAIKARFESLKGVTFDVTDGYYDSVGFLIGMSSSSKRNFKYKLVYEDGTTSTLTSPSIEDTNYSNSASKYASQGFIYRQLMNPTEADMQKPGTTNGGGNSRYLPIIIDTDVSKKLTAIEIIAATDWEVLYLISSWGEKPSFASVLETVPDPSTLTEENIANAQKALAKFLEYVEDCGYSYDDLDDAMKAKVDAINVPFESILANKIATLDENAEITSENIYAYKDMLVEIENYKNANSLDYTDEQIAKINKVKENIEAVEKGVILEDVNNRIEALPSVESITIDNFAEISAIVQEINKIIADNDIDVEEIDASNIAIFNSVREKLELVVLDVQKIIPLNIQDGANTKLFLEENETDPDYKEWVDYIVGTYHGSIPAGTVWTPGVLRYSETKDEKDILISAPNKIWTINGVPYRIGSDVKGIRLHGEKSAEWDADLNKILKTYKSATINLEKGYYDTLYLAASNHCGSTSASTYDPEADVSYVLTYKDGSTTEGKLSVSIIPDTAGTLPSTGYVVRSGLEPGVKNSYIKFANYEIDADPTKQVSSLKLTCTESSRVIFVVGISGETAKTRVVKEAIASKLNYSLEQIGTATKSTLVEIEELVKQYKAVGGDVSAFEGIERFEEDLAYLKENLVDYAEYQYDVDFESTYFEQTFTSDIRVDNEKIKVFKDSFPLEDTEYSLVVEGNKLRVVIPDDHSQDATYKIKFENKSVFNKDSDNFYNDLIKEEEFKAVKPIKITNFSLNDGTISVQVSNNMKAKDQIYLLIIAAYDKDNKLVGLRTVKGEVDACESIGAALDASAFENGVTVECYLADSIDNLMYLDTVDAIKIVK